jgi:methyl-accepting chemotaxis protein
MIDEFTDELADLYSEAGSAAKAFRSVAEDPTSESVRTDLLEIAQAFQELADAYSKAREAVKTASGARQKVDESLTRFGKTNIGMLARTLNDWLQ